MHNGYPPNCSGQNEDACCIGKGDTWLQANLDTYRIVTLFAGAQQPNAAGIGITDDYIITDVFGD